MVTPSVRVRREVLYCKLQNVKEDDYNLSAQQLQMK